MFCLLQSFLCFDLADHLGHGTHGAEAAPGTGLEQEIHHKANDRRGEHQTIETKAELSDPIGNSTGGVCPIPGHAEHPQQLDGFFQIFRSGSHQIGLEDHIAEHGQEEHQETVPEPLGGDPSGRLLFQRTLTANAEELTSAAVTVAEGLVAAHNSDDQRHQKIDHAQPGKENVKKAEGEVKDRPDP